MSRTFDHIRETVASIDEEVKAADVDLGEKKAKIRNSIKGLKESILSGKDSTGDRVKDLAICTFESLDEELSEGLRKIEDMLNGHVGESVLIVSRWDNFYSESQGCHRPPSYRGQLHENYYCGILQSEELSFDQEKERWVFQMDEIFHSDGQSEPTFCDDPYELPMFGIARDLWRGLDKQIILRGTPYSAIAKLLPQVEVVAGDFEVAEFFRRGDIISSATGNMTEWFMKQLRLYEQFMELLDMPIPEIPELEEERRKEKENHFCYLMAILAKHVRLLTNGGNGSDEHKKARKEIQESLERAISLGMHREDYVVDILPLCEKFEVEVP